MNKKNIIPVIIIIVAAIGFYLWQSCSEVKVEKMTSIGIAGWGSNPEFTRNIEGFKDGLAENGYVEGENVHFIIKIPETDLDVQREIIQSFIDAGVDLIFSITTPGTLVAKEMTGTIPIVFSVNTFPVESGVIESLEGSGNNLVGTRNYIAIERQYSLFEKIYPHTKTLAFVHRKGEPNSVAQHLEMKALLEKKGIEVIDIAAVDLADMRAQLESNIEGVDSMFSACDTLTHAPGGEELIVEFSQRHKKPSFACNKEGTLRGHLMGNVADFYAIGKISGRQAALILGGAKPSSLLTESPAEDYLLLNTITAGVLGIEIPQHVLENAKEIIEAAGNR
jgi:putative ABC transport system substrate-binding protein